MHHGRKGALPQLIVFHSRLQPARQHAWRVPKPVAAAAAAAMSPAQLGCPDLGSLLSASRQPLSHLHMTRASAVA